MEKQNAKARVATLALAALGVVYGDIGTSPLYAVKEVFGAAQHPVPISPANVLGILSLFFWSLMVVVTMKYVLFIMRANNKGEGGIMALLTLALQKGTPGSRQQKLLVTLGLFGAALFYGDGVITPAISVLSAVEGLEVITPAFKPWILPITLAVIAVLFVFQRRGTASVGALFGPVMVLWFSVIGVAGAAAIAGHPQVLAAVNPLHAADFLWQNPVTGFFALGAVVLCITGGEALYADMGHFGARPIRLAWLGYVMPALLLNYFGQGALLLGDPASIDNPFFLLVPEWARYPLVILATVATVIASQAVISGAFSMTKQAIQLGYTPRLEIQHTSEHEIGQIYLPAINWLLFFTIVLLVVQFGSSSGLAAAYGIAVTGTMLITNVLAVAVAVRLWGWSPIRAIFGALLFFCVDLAFFLANLVKIPEGGWFPLAFGALVFVLMTTWKRGRELLESRLASDAVDLKPFVASVAGGGIERVPGTAVFLTHDPESVPHALLHSLKHYKALHEQVVFLSVKVLDVPYVGEDERIELRRLNADFSQLSVRYGFMDEPDIPAALALCPRVGLEVDMMDTTFFIGRETLIPTLGSGMVYWRAVVFAGMFRNAGSATAYFKLPSNRVVELGSQVVL
ncbi:MAG: potassium transporter Kup [Candidatus Accumulibacter sp.]|uniref:potassium transporter Kup n=1 Tax=Accumulibacter sp. TaxID=2053492 RepID=UPI0025D00A19|nr:potassium transporter Kup [Accumulibacter sp.]MCM8594832.1 potassium transporter Kup [Accumulibacter sp.]MCM8625654.1 potassium transporter Kup [Accumulibacter sp.]MDS4048978.1 potassium transporter Kup [Accumulibacter sp.]